MLFARKDEKNQKLAAMSMKIFDEILLSPKSDAHLAEFENPAHFQQL